MFVSGYSDAYLKEQLKAKFVGEFKVDGVRSSEDLNYFHRPDLTREGTLEKLVNLEKGLIIMDEVHLATQKEVAWINWCSRRICCLRTSPSVCFAVSATPSQCLLHLQAYGPEVHEIVYLMPGPGYVGVRELLQAGRIRPSKDLSRDPTAWLEVADEVSRMRDTPKIHIVRVIQATQRKRTTAPEQRRLIPQLECHAEANLRRALETVGLMDGVGYRIKNTIPAKLGGVPHHPRQRRTHAHLRVCQAVLSLWRRVDQEHVGILYESLVKQHDTTAVAQGLLGRACGYPEKPPPILFIAPSKGRASGEKFSKYLQDPARRNQRVPFATAQSGRFTVSKSSLKIKSPSSLFDPRTAGLSRRHMEEALDCLQQVQLPVKKPQARLSSKAPSARILRSASGHW